MSLVVDGLRNSGGCRVVCILRFLIKCGPRFSRPTTYSHLEIEQRTSHIAAITSTKVSANLKAQKIGIVLTSHCQSPWVTRVVSGRAQGQLIAVRTYRVTEILTNPRYAFSRGFKQKGYIPLSTYLKTYRVGDIVDIVTNGAVQKGGFDHTY
jgi:hypothetical protein